MVRSVKGLLGRAPSEPPDLLTVTDDVLADLLGRVDVGGRVGRGRVGAEQGDHALLGSAGTKTGGTDDQDALDGVHGQPALARGLELIVRVRTGLVQDRDAELALVGALVVDWASARIVRALQ